MVDENSSIYQLALVSHGLTLAWTEGQRDDIYQTCANYKKPTVVGSNYNLLTLDISDN